MNQLARGATPATRARIMQRQIGLSLLELTAVVAILGVIAYVMAPNLSGSDPQRLELAAQGVAEAIRYAQSEAVRTGDIHAVLIDSDDSDPAGRDIMVFRVDLNASPFGNAGTPYHPLSRQAYDLDLNQGGRAGHVRFAGGARPFAFAGVVGTKNYLHFTAQGVPVWVQDGVFSRLTGGTVQLVSGRHTRTVSVRPVTGQVRVQ